MPARRSIGVLLALLVHAEASAQVNVLTNRYDGARTGANLGETALNATNVNVNQFGKLYSYPVDGSVYAQPLYVTGVTINGTPRNVLYVATMNDKVYAFNADSSAPSPLWMRDFTSPPSVTAVPITDIVAPDLNIIGNVGIQSTPVIDGATGTMYLVARTKESGSYVQRLHALDIATGLSRPGSPVTIQGSFPGTGPDSTIGPSGRVITFNPKMQSQRAGLALTNGVVLIAWASHEDATPYHGWIMGYDSATLNQVAIVSVTPDAYYGGIWQGGRAPTIDAAGNAYFATGNGNFDGTRNFGDSAVKYGVSRSGLTLLDYFTPSNVDSLNANDLDLSGSGFTLIPNTNLLLGGGKEGVLYLLNANNLGHKVTNDTQIPQRISVNAGHVMGGPVYWNSASVGPLIYNWSERDVLKSYRFDGTKLLLPAYDQGTVLSPGHPGGSLTLTANGSAAGSGIVWASIPTNQDGDHGLVAGILRAYNAATLQEIWTSDQNPGRDRVGTLMKFVPPVVANGRVYMPSHDNAVSVYGLFTTTPDFSIIASPSGRSVVPGESTTFTVTIGALNGFSGTVNMGASGQPPGVTASFSQTSVTGSGSTTMTVTTAAGTPTGNITLTIAGNSGVLAHATDVTLFVRTATSGPGAIGIDFVGNGTSMGANESAGVVARTNWNNATGAARSTPLALVDETGAPSGVTVTWTANNVWSTPITDQAGNRRMMKGYLDTVTSGSTMVTVAGLPASSYDVYVYVDGDNGGASRTGAYRLTGTGITPTTINLTDAASANFNTAFTQAANSTGNYVRFSITSDGFTLTATAGQASDGTGRAPVNAIQVVPTGPPPPPDFTVSATPGSRSVVPGSSTSYTVAIGALNGFNGTVNLAVTGLPVDATASFSPATVVGSGNTTLTVTTAASTPIGNSTLTVTATSGSLNHAATATLVVSTATAGGVVSINFVGTGTAMGAGESAGVVAKPSWNNATGAARSTPLALVDENGLSSTATVTWAANGVGSTAITDQAGNRRLMKGYLDTTATSVTTVTVSGLPSSAYDVYVYADGSNGTATRTGGYRISGAGITTTTVNLTDAAGTNFNTTFTQAANTSGNYVKFSVTGTGFTLTATPGTASDGNPRAPLNGIQIVPTAPPPPDFTLTVTPGSRTVNPGGIASYTVGLGVVGGFTGTVTLAVDGLPANATASFTPPTVTGSGTATLNVTTAASPATSNSTLTVTGTSGSLTHSATTALVVSPPSAAAVVSINFVGNGTAMGTGETAGVVAKPFWNNAIGATRSTPLALVTETGAASGATVTWTANNLWSTPVTDQAGNRRAMKGYLDTSTTSVTTVTLGGLPAGTFDVYVYADGDNGSATRTGAYAISGAGIATTTINMTDPGATNFNATFTQANNSNGNYVKFTVTPTGGGFTLTASPGTASDGNKRAPLNAIQIVPVQALP